MTSVSDTTGMGHHAGYWQELLANAPEPTPLFDDRSPGNSLTADAAREQLIESLEELELTALHAACRDAGVELPTLVQAAWAFVLSLYTREPDVLFAHRVASDRIIPALVRVPAGVSVRGWLVELDRERRTRVARAESFAAEAGGHAPETYPSVVSDVDATQALRSVLWLNLCDGRLSANYATSRLDGSAARRILLHVKLALMQLAGRLEAHVDELSLVTAADKATLDRVNDTGADYPRDVCLHTLIEAQVERSPDAIAVVDDHESLSYAALNARANKLAQRLLQLGVGPDVMVGICVDRSVQMLVGLLAILKAGGAYVPLDPGYPAERLKSMLEDAEVPTILVQKHTASVLPQTNAQLIALDDPKTFDVPDASNPNIGVQAHNLAYVIFTSGSTGRPKGAMNEHLAVVNMLLWHRDTFNVTPQDCFLQKTAFSFDVSVFELFLPLITGAKLVMARPGAQKDSDYLLETMRHHGVTIVHFVASMLRMFLDHPGAGSCTSLRHVFCSGEAISLHLQELYYSKLSAPLEDLYGPTEAAVHVTYWQCERHTKRNNVPIGRPTANTQVHVLDARGRVLPVGVPGELHIGGVQVARGYLKREELTREKFVPDPFAGDATARLYKTGDLARITEEGLVEYLGRIDFQIKLRGFRIELGEIEAAILKQPQVAQAVVLLRTDREDDAYLAAYLVGSSKEQPTEAIKSRLLQELPEFMVPTAFVWLDKLPLNPSGKLDRKALPIPSRTRPDLGKPLTPPRNEREALLCRAFAEVLGMDELGAEDGFFELGGNSLLSMKLLSRLRDKAGIDVPVARFFQYPTPRALDRFLSKESDAATTRLPRRTRPSGHLEDVAIIGMAGRFPGAPDVATLWKNIVNCIDSTTDFTAEQLDPSLPPELGNDPMYVKSRGVVADYDKFDAAFFGIPPRDAELMDPQQRLFLEVCWEALENAGYAPETIRGLAGVFGGAYGNTYITNNILTHPAYEQRLGSFGVLVQNEGDYVATRVAHKLDLLGPAVSLNTACSTSLVAVVEAFHSLRAGRCDLALAGGVSITCPPHSGYWYIEGGMLSPDGRTRSFDKNAGGTSFNDGVATLVLKRLNDALEDGDTIYAVIRGAAINNDGGRKASFTAPSVEGQAAVIRMAQAMADVDPRSITYVEAHGTATPIGDPIEVEALTEAFRDRTQDRQFCAIGSIKSNIGHTVAAAGAAGLIKTALALSNRVIPPVAHFVSPNPRIDFASSPFYVASSLTEWSNGPTPRRAGVSSFGVGGTNAHVVLEEAPAVTTTESPRTAQLLLLSARSPAALERSAERLSAALNERADLDLADVSATLARGRRAFSERRFVVAKTNAEAAAALAKPSTAHTRHYDGREPKVAFLFPGQGAQYANMGLAMYRDEPVFRTIIDECAAHLDPLLDRPLKSILYPAEGAQAEASEALKNTAYTQPALFAIEYATAQLLIGWGIKPTAMVGHSIGEFVCAVLSGVMTLGDALTLVAARGRMMQDLPRGSMLSVRLPASQVLPRLDGGLGIASDNGPSLCVVAGPTDEVERLQQKLEAEGVVCRLLLTSHAFHSSMMDPIVGPFSERVSKVRLSPPKIPFVSTLTGTWIRDEEATSAEYWGRHLRSTVKFATAIKTLLETPDRVLVEAGPRGTLSTLARQQVEDASRLIAVPTLGDSAENGSEWVSMQNALGRLWTAGVQIDWDSYFIEERRRRVPLPTYPFEHKRFWIEPAWAPAAHHPSTMPESSAPRLLEQALTQAKPAPAPTAAGAPAPTAAPQVQGPRLPRIITELRAVFEDASGFDMEAADEEATFLEVGLDSLALTQIALQLQKQFGVKVTFRELMDDYSSLQTLGKYLDENMPPDQIQEPPAPAAEAAGATAQQPYVATGQAVTTGPVAQPMAGQAPLIQRDIAQLLQQQLMLTHQLLGTLAGTTGNIPLAAPPAPTGANGPSAASALPAFAQAPMGEPPAAGATQPTAPTNGQPSTAAGDPAVEEPVEVSLDKKDNTKKAFGAIARINTNKTDDLTTAQRAKLDAFIRRYTARTKRSKEHTQQYRACLADPRAVTGFRPPLKELVYQIVIDRSEGSRLWDIDGNEYVDALNGFGSSIFGWRPSFIDDAIIAQLARGHEIGPMPTLAGEVAQLICEFTGFDRAGFCNTGSEAVMGCMRVARTVTGRTMIASFNNSYHGIFDEVIVRGTKKLRPVPAAPGLVPSSVQNMLVLDYGTPESLEILRQRGSELAAILIEPVQSRRPDFHPREFMHEARKIADACGAVLIFDEVITGFRSHPGGAQAVFGVRADIASYGKVIGGGLPFGVVAGKAQYMDALDGGFWQYGDDSLPTAGVTYFAGTFCRHPLALAAAKASLLEFKRQGPALQEELNTKTAAMAQELNAYFRSVKAPLEIRYFSSLWKTFITEDLPYGDLIFYYLRDRGVHILEGFPCFMTTAHSEADIATIVKAFQDSVAEMQAAGFLPGEPKAQVAPVMDATTPPVPGARLGRDRDGTPSWFVPHPEMPGKYVKYGSV